jgi:ankyrin repeat protein
MNELSAKETSLELREAMHDLPAELPALYSRMLRKVSSSKREAIVAMLNWIVLAIRPLTPSELSTAITCQAPGNMDRAQFTRDLITICQPFISVQNGSVLLVHQSAKDYLLLEGETSNDLAEVIPTSIANAHLCLANACLDALGTPSGLTQYATEHWADHFRQLPAFVQASLIEQNSFFDTTSAERQAWWMNYVKRDGITYRNVFKGECPPPFHIACYFDNNLWAQKILSQKHSGVSRTLLVNSPAGPNWSRPLHYALMGNAKQIFPLLLANGADPTLFDNSRSSLTLATHTSNETGLRYLLEYLKFQISSGTSSHVALDGTLHLASSVPIAEMLLDSGADPNSTLSYQHQTPLQLAIRRGHAALVDLLLRHGANPRAVTSVDTLSVSPVNLAIRYEHQKIIALLLDRDADLNMESEQSLSLPLLMALHHNNLSLAETLVQRGALLDGVTSSTRLLWVCIREASVCGVEFALQHGADANVVLGGPLGGFTGLHWTVIEWRRREHSPMVQAAYTSITRRLLSHGADPELQDRRGKTATDYAAAERTVLEPLLRLAKESQDTAGGAARVDRGSSKPDLRLLKTGGTRSRPPEVPWRPGLRRKSSDNP